MGVVFRSTKNRDVQCYEDCYGDYWYEDPEFIFCLYRDGGVLETDYDEQDLDLQPVTFEDLVAWFEVISTPIENPNDYRQLEELLYKST